MAIASFIIGKAALVPKCNAPNTRTKHYSLSCNNKSGRGTRIWITRASGNMATEVVEEKLGVKIQRNPPESKLSQLGVRNWPKPRNTGRLKVVRIHLYSHPRNRNPEFVIEVPQLIVGTFPAAEVKNRSIHCPANAESLFILRASFINVDIEKWGCPPSSFPWTYSSKETCYVLQGKVKVYPDGSDEAVEFGAGDLVEFPNGMTCTWDVSETVDKHYKFE